MQDLEVASAEDPEDEIKQLAPYQTGRSLHGLYWTQAHYAFQQVETDLTKKSLTQDDLKQCRHEMMQPGKIQQMLLVAAKDAIVASTAVDAETIAEGFENSYDLQDRQDVRDRPEDEGTVIVDSMTAAEDPPNMAKDGEDAIAAMAAACRMLMEVLVGAVEIDFTPMPCIQCQDDENVPKSKQDQRYLPGEHSQHTATAYHSPRSRFLRRFKHKGLCPYGCGKQFAGKALRQHVLAQTGQSEDHLLAAARAEVFA